MSIYDSLNPEQLRAVTHTKGPLLILAGAGSGKTRVLTHRIAYLIDEVGVNPWNILALTFTNKAAREMRDRVDQIVGYGSENIWVTTFHSTCVRILRKHIHHLGYENSFTIYDTDDQRSLMKDICKYLELDPKRFKERSLLAAISNAKNELITPEEYERSAGHDFAKSKYSAAYKEYQKRLKANNALDFDDLIFKTVELLEENPDILYYYQRRFQYILIDEYQDTNTAQFQLIRILASTENEQGEIEHNLCVVGDDDQSIYKFRGANIYNILNFEEEYPDCFVIKLEQNYRSTKHILKAANEVIHHNTERKAKALWTENEEGELIYYTQFDTEYNEAESIASDIEQLVEERNLSYSDFAILYRTNAQSRILEEKLIYRNIPYKIIGGVNFYQRKEIKDLLAYLKTIDNGMDEIAVKRIINVPRRGIGLTTIDRIDQYARQQNISFYEALKRADFIPGIGRGASKISPFVSFIEILKSKLNSPSYTISELLEEILEATGYARELEEDGSDEALGRLENIDELKNKIIVFEEQGDMPPTLSEFLEEVALVADIDTLENSTNLVVLMTLHSAKGLEFPYVYLCGMEDGIFPSYLTITSDDPSDIEEERRLCYVGITRAMKRLYLSSARQRMQHGETMFNKPSRFLDEIPPLLIKKSSNSLTSRFPRTEQTNVYTKNLHSYGKEIRGAIAPNYTNKKKQEGINLDNNPYIQKGFGNQVTRNYQIFDKPNTVTSNSGALSSAPNYVIGDTVKHMRFGEGIVIDLKKGVVDYEVTVDFSNFGKKKMQAGFAKLEKI